MPTPHQTAHAAPKPESVIRDYTMTDGNGKRFLVAVEVRPELIAQALATYARANRSKLSKACDGGVLVHYLGEVA